MIEAPGLYIEGDMLMTDLLKSKLGLFLTGVYLIMVCYAVLEGSSAKPEPMDNFALIIVTSPWSFLLMLLLAKLGIMTTENGDSFLPLLVIFGGLINALILYWIGYLVTKLLTLFYSGKNNKNDLV